MIRGQFTFYDHPGTDGWAEVGGVGIVEAPIGMFRTERIRSFQAVGGRDSVFLLLGDYDEEPPAGAGCELSHIVTSDRWPCPHEASHTGGGGIMFRRTRVPASPGHETLSAAMCLRVEDGTLRSFVRYAVAAAAADWQKPGELLVHDPVHHDLLAQRGIGMASLLKQPCWGWSDEPFALQSTMDLETIDACSELYALRRIAAPSPDQARRREALEGGEARWIVNAGAKEPAYAEFLARIPGDPTFDDWSNPVTSAQLAARHETVARIVRKIKGREYA